MNQVYQGESSSGLSIQPMKRKRGRPRKDPSLKHALPARPPPGFEAPKEYIPPKADKPVVTDYMVGQEVTGVIEASFDAGYLLSVRIGNSNTHLRGVVFKPGHYVPITAQNDVAPHVQMIQRNDVPFPAENKVNSHGQNLAIQTSNLVPAKRKYALQNTAPSVPPVGVRGTVLPVVLQPVNFSNGLSNSHHMPSDASNMLAFGDKDVHMVEPISMLPPDRSIPVTQIFVAAQTQPNHQVTQEIEQNDNAPVGEGISVAGEGEKAKLVPAVFTDDMAGSSQTLDTKIENGKEVLKSSNEDAGVISKQAVGNNDPMSTESLQTSSVSKPFFHYGTGRMTELLQAVQENMKENQVQIAEQQTSESKVELHEPRMEKSDPKNEASAA